MEEIENSDVNSINEIGGVLVSKLITNQGKKPMFLFREKRTRVSDSGWRIFSGLESDEYVNNSENLGIYHPSHIIEIEKSIESLLLKGVGSVFERINEQSEWVEVLDYKLEDDYFVDHLLTSNWSIRINNLFERIKEDNGDLLYTTGDKSIRIAIWNLKGSKEEILKDHLEQINNRDESASKTLKKYNLSDSQVSRIGYKIKESDKSKEYEVIYAFSIIKEEVLQLAFYFDHDKNESWALETWKNIRVENDVQH
jgi:hypothetical protein